MEKKKLTMFFRVDNCLMAHLSKCTVVECTAILDKEHVFKDPLTDVKAKLYGDLVMKIYFVLKRDISFS